jgi:hypothetical protein
MALSHRSTIYLGALPQLAQQFDVFRADLNAMRDDAQAFQREVSASTSALHRFQSVVSESLLSTDAVHVPNTEFPEPFDRSDPSVASLSYFDIDRLNALSGKLQTFIPADQQSSSQPPSDTPQSLSQGIYGQIHLFNKTKLNSFSVAAARRLLLRVQMARDVQRERQDLKSGAAVVGLPRHTPSKQAPPDHITIGAAGEVIAANF